MDNRDVLATLEQLEREEKEREARLGTFTRIREVVLHYEDLLAQIPAVERNLAAAQQNYDEVSSRLNDQLSGLRSQNSNARRELEKEKEALEVDRVNMVKARTELQNDLEAAQQTTKQKLAMLEVQMRDAENRLKKAQTDLAAFKQKHLS